MGESRAQTKETVQGLSLARADIVILANAHNPSIVSPEWLHENCGIDEKPKKLVQKDAHPQDPNWVPTIMNRAAA